MSCCEPYKNNFAELLRRYVGRGKDRIAVEDFADDTGLSPRRLYGLMSGEFQPNLTDLIQIGQKLPSEFLAQALRPAGVVDVSKAQEPLNNGAVLQSRVCHMASKLADALEDGRIDHRERAELEPLLRRLIEDGRAYLSSNVEAMTAKRGA